MLILNTLKLKFITSNWYKHGLIKTDIKSKKKKAAKTYKGSWQHKAPLLFHYSPVAGDLFQATSATPIRPEKSYRLLTGENKLFCNRRSGLNDLLVRTSVSRLWKFVPWIFHCLNTDLNSSQAFKRATLNSSLKPFRKASNRDSSHFSSFSPEMRTHTATVWWPFISNDLPAASPGKEVTVWYSEHLQTLGWCKDNLLLFWRKSSPLGLTYCH